MSDDDLLWIYRDMTEATDFDMDCLDIEELRAVVAADSDEAAGALIEWWGGWGTWQEFESPGEWADEFRRRVAEAA